MPVYRQLVHSIKYLSFHKINSLKNLIIIINDYFDQLSSDL